MAEEMTENQSRRIVRCSLRKEAVSMAATPVLVSSLDELRQRGLAALSTMPYAVGVFYKWSPQVGGPVLDVEVKRDGTIKEGAAA
jgi:hypothetical protein